MLKQEKVDINFYLTKKQKEAVDNNLKEVASGNYNSRRYKYYYILHLLNVNQQFGKCDDTYISSRSLKKYFHQDTVTAEIKQNLISWGIIKMSKNYSFNPHTGKAQAPAFQLVEEYRGKLNEIISIDANNKDAKFVKTIIKNRNEVIRSYNQLQQDIFKNLELLTVEANCDVIDSSINLHRISTQTFNISESKYGRITTELCGVERVNRKHLRLDGKSLIEIDVANCQPLLSCVIFKRYFMENNMDLPDDLIAMYNQCVAGSFYDQIMNILNIPSDTRNAFKENFFELFFASNGSKKSEVYTVFKQLYPNVADALFKIKQNNYKSLARELQRIESGIIFSTLRKLYDKGINALTIHDSIVVNNMKDAEIAKDLLQDEFLIKHKLTPKLKITNYGDAILKPIETANHVKAPVQPEPAKVPVSIDKEVKLVDYYDGLFPMLFAGYKTFENLISGLTSDQIFQVKIKMLEHIAAKEVNTFSIKIDDKRLSFYSNETIIPARIQLQSIAA